MVNNQTVRLVVAADVEIVESEKRKKISNGPIYDLAVAQAMLRANGLRVVNDDAHLDQTSFDPVLTDDELTNFILELSSDRYVESERCRTSSGMTIDCDAYAMCWNRFSQREWGPGMKIFVKFGFRPSNARCLVVSIHPANW